MSEKVNVILNGEMVPGNKGETILQLAERNGFEIPITAGRKKRV